jgi:hypothetical protein
MISIKEIKTVRGGGNVDAKAKMAKGVRMSSLR